MNDDDFDAMIEDFGYVIWADQFHNTELAALTAEEITFLADRGARFEEMWEELFNHLIFSAKDPSLNKITAMGASMLMKTLKHQHFPEGV